MEGRALRARDWRLQPLAAEWGRRLRTATWASWNSALQGGRWGVPIEGRALRARGFPWTLQPLNPVAAAPRGCAGVAGRGRRST